MFGIEKREASWHGIECIADMGTPEYMAAKAQSQKQVAWADQVDYGYYTLYFGCATLGVALLKHLFYSYRDRMYKRAQKENGVTSFVDVCTAYFRFFGYKQVPAKISYFTSLPPSVGSSLYLVASTLYLSLYCLVPHFWLRGCRGFGSPPLAVRAGIMATALTPFIYILSGKSNMITLFTGISYEKLNYLHQYIAVAALVLSIIHTIPFFYQALHEGGQARLAYFFKTNFYFYSGVPPLVLLILLCVMSKAYFRKHVYEWFLHSHWIMGMGYFATLMWHVWQQLGTDNYMWASLAFWASQLIYRALVKTAFRPNALFLRPREGRLSKLEGTNAYQIVVPNVKNMMWKPGQHVFLRFVGSRILDNHPFSICSLPQEGNHEMKFIVVPKKGLTGILYNELEDYVTAKKKVFVDGPYGGSPRDIESFEKVVLIATGSGVTATLPFLTQLATAVSKAKDACVTQEVNFIWIVNSAASIEWIKDELNHCVEIADKYVTVDIYIHEGESTTEQKASIPQEKLEEAVETKSTSSISSSIGVHHYKPNVQELVSSLGPTLKQRNMFVSSGSDSMKFEVSQAVSEFQPLIFNQGIHSSVVNEVHLHTETFGW